MDLGFELEGYEVVWANDFDDWACETYKKNFKGKIIQGNIADIDFTKTPNNIDLYHRGVSMSGFI